MWISEKEIYRHVPNVERCVNGQDTKNRKSMAAWDCLFYLLSCFFQQIVENQHIKIK